MDSKKKYGTISDQAAPVMKVNTPLQQHASTVYTRAMFEKFGEVLYEGALVEEVEKGVKYLVHRYHPERHDKWCRVVYAIAVMDKGAEVSCECGNFEHMGLLCCHVLKVHSDYKRTYISIRNRLF